MLDGGFALKGKPPFLKMSSSDSCRFCSAERTRLFFNEGDTGTEGYRCVKCGCTFIVLKKGMIPEPEDDREEHARDI